MTNRYESPLSSRYASEYMLGLFSSETRYQTWRKLWVALAKAEMTLGLPITQAQVDELAAASKHGLYARHFQDNYVYLVDDSGRAAAFHGFMGDKNVDVNAPYLVCDKHTKEDWEASQNPTEPEDPTDPSEPEVEFPLFPEDPFRPGWGT